jgi:hypothetical protein
MFFEVGDGLRDVPRKHILVYTLMCFPSQVLRRACQRALSGTSVKTFTPQKAPAKDSLLREPKRSSRLCPQTLRLDDISCGIVPVCEGLRPGCPGRVVTDAQGLIDQFHDVREEECCGCH